MGLKCMSGLVSARPPLLSFARCGLVRDHGSQNLSRTVEVGSADEHTNPAQSRRQLGTTAQRVRIRQKRFDAITPQHRDHEMRFVQPVAVLYLYPIVFHAHHLAIRPSHSPIPHRLQRFVISAPATGTNAAPQVGTSESLVPRRGVYPSIQRADAIIEYGRAGPHCRRRKIESSPKCAGWPAAPPSRLRTIPCADSRPSAAGRSSQPRWARPRSAALVSAAQAPQRRRRSPPGPSPAGPARRNAGPARHVSGLARRGHARRRRARGVVRRGKWFRGEQVAAFESAYASLTGAKGCLATANGTSALITSLAALGIGPGDEVIVPPYTFIATVNAVLLMHALPVFVDTDIDTFQIDARKIEAAITPRTRAVIPVHLGGSAADLDTILPIAAAAASRSWKTPARRTSPSGAAARSARYGMTGCFSFQASKNLNSGEGGAVLTNDAGAAGNLLSVPQQQPRPRRHRNRLLLYPDRREPAPDRVPGRAVAGADDAAGSTVEDEGAERGLSHEPCSPQIPGIAPARMYEGCTRNAWHLYMFRYDSSQFSGLPRAAFLKALAAEGIPASGGYSPLNTQPFLDETLQPRIQGHLSGGDPARAGATATAARRTIACARRRSG